MATRAPSDRAGWTVAPACVWSLAATLFVPSSVLAQDNPVPTRASGSSIQVSALSSIELWLAGAIILFGFIVLGMQYSLLRRSSNTQAEDILRLFTVTMIIVGTLALIAIGYSSQQIAPALGLFGTILGYLLGRTDERRRANSTPASGAGEPPSPERPGGG